MISRTSVIASLFAVAAVALPRVAHADDAKAAATPEPSSNPDREPSEHPSPWSIDVAPALAMPMGNLGSATGPAIGGVGGGSLALRDSWDLVGHVGYLQGTTTSTTVAGVSVSSSVSFTPVLAGLRYYLTDPGWPRLYAQGEAGIVVAGASVSVSEGSTAASGFSSSSHAGSALSLGMQLDMLDVRAGLFTADLSHADSSTSVLMSAGLRFASL